MKIVVKNERVDNVIIADESFWVNGLEDSDIPEIGIGWERREGKWGNPETHIFKDGEWREIEYSVSDDGEQVLKVDGETLEKEDFDAFKRSVESDSGSELKS